MRFLTDQDVYHVTVAWLRDRGDDVATARELELQQAADHVLLQEARERGRILVTRDKDFGALVFLQVERTPGVILLRLRPTTIEEVHAELNRLLEAHTEEELQELFCVVEPQRHRIRRVRARD
jgi:predicted nuclease of predicted toxin-antitoxin system